MAGKAKAQVTVVVEEAVGVENVMAGEEAEVAEKLALAKPAEDEAGAAVQSITEEDVKKISQMAGKPPALITNLTSMCLIVFHKPMHPIKYVEYKGHFMLDGQDDWANGETKTMLKDKLYEKLSDYIKQNEKTNDETCEFLDAYFMSPTCTVEMAKSSAEALPGLLNWCRAMKKYYFVAKDVGPEKWGLQRAREQLQPAKAKKEAA